MAADGFGGAEPPRAEGLVCFDVEPAEGGYVATGDEPDFGGEGRADTAALAIADYCEQYDEFKREGGDS